MALARRALFDFEVPRDLAFQAVPPTRISEADCRVTLAPGPLGTDVHIRLSHKAVHALETQGLYGDLLKETFSLSYAAVDEAQLLRVFFDADGGSSLDVVAGCDVFAQLMLSVEGTPLRIGHCADLACAFRVHQGDLVIRVPDGALGAAELIVVAGGELPTEEPKAERQTTLEAPTEPVGGAEAETALPSAPVAPKADDADLFKVARIGRGYAWTDAQDTVIRLLYRDGKSVNALAKDFSVSFKTMSDRVDALGLRDDAKFAGPAVDETPVAVRKPARESRREPCLPPPTESIVPLKFDKVGTPIWTPEADAYLFRAAKLGEGFEMIGMGLGITKFAARRRFQTLETNAELRFWEMVETGGDHA